MQVNSISLMVLSEDPVASAKFYTEHFGFTAVAQLPWFVSLQHPEHDKLNLDLLKKNHEAAGPHLQSQTTSGVMLALVVNDLDLEAGRLLQEGLTFLMPPTAEPWGQKRLQLLGPDGVVVELLQFVAPDPDWLARQS